MNESKKIINAGLGYTIGNILIKGISFLTIPLYTRLMSTSDYGIYNTYVAYVGIITFIVCLGLDPTLKNAEIDYPDKKNSFLSTVYCLTFLSFLICLLLVLIFGKWLCVLTDLEWGMLILLVLNAETAAIVNIYNIKLSLSFSSRSYLKISFFQTIMGVILSVALMLSVYDGKRYWGRIIGMLIPALIVAGYIIWKAVLSLPCKMRFNAEMAKYSLKLGLPLIPHLLSQVLNSQFDRIMISTIVGYAQSGIYSFACNIAIIFQILYQSLDTVWSPWFFEKMKQKDYDGICSTSKKYMILVSFFAVGLMTISREFIMIFATEEYWSGMSLAPVLIFGFYFLFLYTLPAGVEYYTKNTKYIAVGSIVSAVINIVLNYFAIRIFGYKAAAYTTLISYIVLFLMHWGISRKIFSEKLFDGRFILKLIGTICVWHVFCIATQELWALRYFFFAIVVGFTLRFFKSDILNYIKR